MRVRLKHMSWSLNFNSNILARVDELLIKAKFHTSEATERYTKYQFRDTISVIVFKADKEIKIFAYRPNIQKALLITEKILCL